MDSTNPGVNILNRLISGLKDKTIQFAEQKLQKNLQSTPEEAILALVASAVQSNARRFEVRIEGNDLVLTHDGTKVREAEIAQLLQNHSSLTDLSRGLHIHLGQKDSHVQLQFLSEIGMHQADFKPGAAVKIQTVDLQDLHLAKMTTRIILKGTGNYRRINQAIGNELPEVVLIRKRCFLSPLDITILARPLEKYLFLPDSLICGRNIGQKHHQTLSNLPSSPKLPKIVDLSFLNTGISTIDTAVAGIAQNNGDSGWFFLENGIARPLTNVAWPARSWGYIDLGSKPNIEQLELEIRLIVAALTSKLFEETIQNSGNCQEETLSFLEQNKAVLSEAGFSALDQDRLFLAIRERISPSSDPRVLQNRLELATSLEASGDSEQSRELFTEVLPIWESEALNHFDKYRFDEGAILWQRALAMREKLNHDPNDLCDRYLRLAEIGKDQRLGFAEQAYRRALQLERSSGVSNSKREYQILVGLAEVLKKNRVLTESLTLAESAHKLMLEILAGKETRDLVPVLKLQAELHDLLNDYSRSTDFEQKALLLKFKR